MKKQIKPIILSAAAALAFGGIAVGTTFALFTSKDETTIQVNSGKVDVSSVASIVNVYELNNDQPLVPSEQGVYTNSIGGTTSIEDNVVTLNNWAPGDKVVIDLQNLNKSTVSVLTRLAIYHNSVSGKGDLYPALDITIRRAGETDPIDPAELFKWTKRDVPENPDSGESFDHLEITIEFPDHDNGEIIFGSSNSDNQYQDCACVISLGLEAVQGNAYISPATTFNEYARYVGDVITMSDAVEAADKLEYTLADFEGYVWDSKNYQFVSESSVEENFNQYFKAYNAMPGDQTFSIYANAASWDASVSLAGVGFDAGSANGITSINYVGLESARENIIVSNSLNTNINVNAPLDTVHHYGDAGSVNIEAVANSSYHEYGTVGFTEIAKGRIVLEQDSEIKQVHVNANSTATGFDTVVLKDNGARSLPEKITRDAVTVETDKELVITVQVSDTSSEQVYVYAEGNKGTTEKTATQNTNVESAIGALVLDNGGDPAEKALDTEEKAEEKEEAIIEVIDESTDYVARIGTTVYETLQEAWNNGKNKTITLLSDLAQNGFYAYGVYTLDLNHHELRLNGHSAIYGAFGTDGGANRDMTNLTIKNGTLNLSGSNYSKYGIYNYGTLNLKDLIINSPCETVIYSIGQQWGTAGTTTLDNVTINSTHTSGTAVAAYSFKNSWGNQVKPNIVIKNSTISATNNAVMIYGTDATVDNCNITATNNDALWISNSANGQGLTGTITVKGNTTINAGSDYKRLNAANGQSIVIIEGTYNFDPSNNNSKNYVNTENYSVSNNGDGTWTVSAK